VADEGSFFSRFTVKFAEITAAGVATAVSGYLIAHVGGFLFSAAPSPAVVGTSAPAAVQVSVSPPASPAPLAVEAGERRPPEHDVHTAPVAPEPPRKAEADANAGKPRDVSRDAPHDAQRDTQRDSANTTPAHDMESIEAKVRAALAKSDANRPAPHEAHPADTHQAETPAATQMRAATPPPQSAAAVTGTIMPVPRIADIAPPPLQQSAPQAPLQPAPPLATVEVPSRPVAGDTAPPQERAQQSGQDNPQGKQASNHTGDQNAVAEFFGAFKKIPGMLRNDKPEPDDEAPRPPLPVGE
jgi:hypothetical protein